MNILYVTSEAVPFCKTGGLADVAGSLPQSLAANGDRVSVILPLYQSVADAWRDRLHFERYTYVRLAWRSLYCGLFSYERQGVTWYFVDNEQYFKRPELYGYYDDGERFAFFCRAVTELLPLLPEKPDVVHCNDWQTALVPVYIRDEAVREEFYKSVRTVITVHNIEYQGRYDPYCLGDLFGLDRGWVDDGTLLLDGDLNLLKGAILTADAVNAVSPTYAQELKNPYFAHRMEGILTQCGYKLSGVLNGIDMKLYDPAADGRITANYTAEDLSGKAVALTQTGSYLANVGKMTIAEDGAITTELISTADVSDAAVAATAEAWINDVDAMLGEQIATTDINFYINDPATGKRRIRMGETNLGDFVADGIYAYFNEIEELHCDIAVMNGGGIRADVPAGAWSFKTCKTVSPFGNVACLMSVTGKQIQDALEFAARFAGEGGKENGGFLHVAGASYEIHADIPNTVQTDDKNVWIGSATGTPRVQNVKIYDRANGTYVPLDENKTYALAGMNYTLRNLGDGFAMFDGAELIKDYVSEDYLVMSTYAMTFGGVDAEGLPHLSSANSVLAEYPGYLLDYENPYGAGRISIL